MNSPCYCSGSVNILLEQILGGHNGLNMGTLTLSNLRHFLVVADRCSGTWYPRNDALQGFVTRRVSYQTRSNVIIDDTSPCAIRAIMPTRSTPDNLGPLWDELRDITSFQQNINDRTTHNFRTNPSFNSSLSSRKPQIWSQILWSTIPLSLTTSSSLRQQWVAISSSEHFSTSPDSTPGISSAQMDHRVRSRLGMLSRSNSALRGN